MTPSQERVIMTRLNDLANRVKFLEDLFEPAAEKKAEEIVPDEVIDDDMEDPEDMEEHEPTEE